MIRVLLVDDQVLFAETLQTVISMKADDIDVVEIAYNGQEAIEAALRLVPDIILMDVRMPILDGVQAACRIHLNQPGIRIMMLTTFDDDAYVHDALEGGAVGYLLKNMPSDDLINSIRAVNNGTLQISPSVASQLVSSQKTIPRPPETEDPPVKEIEYNIDVLSRREREILYLMSRGYDNSHIAGRLFLADQTVKNHISRIYNKLDVHDRMSVMKAARHSELKEYCRYLLDDE
ncbi:MULTISPECIES: response regulator transcription factor [unclassified Oceanispirochaeta]|uniref:response regulator transcription factor n=1 Tax=unclassified Oceanispirochaeta TaxID=2635722 RepID=UPI000E0915B4|nr:MULTISPECIES: response regulator transcription factor [unclassified Oceanispirochaeta]MBF9015859.1 response regulator transcription factor [Oceanispirochaeta sp. M2]NPD72322.1 response regulator transcription factor [Oceanispirochaeta sp. M1]RDG32092.1 DNA-binding response regulator [Oceanispirochaeta sp. M1]